MMLAMTLTSLLVGAEPCTLYKAEDIARARANLERHPWARKVQEGWERSVSHILEQDTAYIEGMIDSLTPWTTYGNNCPVCVGRQSSMGEIGLFQWNVSTPDTLVCKYCKTVFPHPDYPETGRLECPRMGQTFTYYETADERAHPEDSTGKYAFRWASWPVHTSWSGLLRHYRAAYCMGKVLPLAKLYAVTGEVRYAEMAVLILDRVAQVYPGWLYHAYNGTYADCPPAEAAAELGRNPRGGRFPKEVIRSASNLHQFDDYATLCNGFWGAGRFGTGSAEGSYLLNFTVAYDLVREAVTPAGQRVLSGEQEKRIVNDLILAGCADRENWAEINNKAGPNRALSAAVGILFARPESVRRALDGFERLLEQCFHYDGFCRESPSYSGMHLSLMENIPIILRGYSDPPGYVPEQGERFERLNPFARVGRYRLALESMVRMLAPGRRYPVLGDTHYRAGLSAHYAEVLTDWYGERYAGLLETAQGAPLAAKGGENALWYRDADVRSDGAARLPLRSEWFPGWQVGVLRAGRPDGDTALYFNGYAQHGHRHYDTLGILFYGHGRELASDRGYIWDDPRNAWTRSTLAHNLVTVDGQDQGRAGRTSVLELFATAPGVEVVRARGENVYPQCSLYRRTSLLLGEDGASPYVLDVFEVHGGKRHQYGLVCNGALVSPDPAGLTALSRSHRWLANFRSIDGDSSVPVRWQDEDVFLECRLLTPCDQLVVADAPGWRSDKGSELNAPPVQQMFAERALPEGSADALQSRFAALLIPHQGDSIVQSARMLPLEGSAEDWAVRVECSDWVDVVVATSGTSVVACGPLRTDARLAVVRFSATGALERATMIGGTTLVCGEVTLSVPEAQKAVAIEAVDGCRLTVSDSERLGRQAVGSYLLTGGTGFEISEIAAGRVVVRDYPLPQAGPAVLWHSASFERVQ